jgi:hypothetical protein
MIDGIRQAAWARRVLLGAGWHAVRRGEGNGEPGGTGGSITKASSALCLNRWDFDAYKDPRD